MRKYLAILLLLIAVPSYPWSLVGTVGAPAGGEVLQQSDTELYEVNSIMGGDFADWYAATFVTGASGYSLTKVELYMRCNASSAQVARVYIYTDNTGVPGTLVPNGTSNDLTANGGVLTSSYSYVPFTFSSPPVLSSGTTYWIIVYNVTNNHSYGMNIYRTNNSVEIIAASSDGLSWAQLSTDVGTHTYKTYGY